MKTNCTWNKIHTLTMAYNIQNDLVLTRFVTPDSLWFNSTAVLVPWTLQVHFYFRTFAFTIALAWNALSPNHTVRICTNQIRTVFVTFSVGFQLNCYFLTKIFSNVPTSIITLKNTSLFYCLHNMYRHPKLTHLWI